MIRKPCRGFSYFHVLVSCEISWHEWLFSWSQVRPSLCLWLHPLKPRVTGNTNSFQLKLHWAVWPNLNSIFNAGSYINMLLASNLVYSINIYTLVFSLLTFLHVIRDPLTIFVYAWIIIIICIIYKIRGSKWIYL